ncbi:MAG: hypothetical protein NTY90_00665, partial [Candidatus Micrarchaeota archaeon]|nr:hypothetical protein [Candidatus Micrarchaeota archaeon]
EPGFGSAVLEGIRKGLRAEKPDYVMTMFADYQMESRHLGGVIKPLASGAADFVSSAWKHGHATALEYPLPQYLNETRVSAAVTYANPHFKPRNLNPYAAVPQALGEGRAFQVFSGVFGFPAKAWPVLEKQLAAFGGASGHVNSWGLEPALMLSALNARLRVSNAFFSRGYEHPFPTDRKKFVRSRLQQFDSGMAVVKHFLAATGQREKLSALEPVISQERKRIENSPLKRPFHERLVKEFRPTFLYRK